MSVTGYDRAFYVHVHRIAKALELQNLIAEAQLLTSGITPNPERLSELLAMIEERQ